MTGWRENTTTREFVEQHTELATALDDADGVVYVEDIGIMALIEGRETIKDFVAGPNEAWDEAASIGFQHIQERGARWISQKSPRRSESN